MVKYTRSAKYDQGWVEQHWMGPHPLYLLEDLCEHMDLRPGMKVLDMGCGKGLTSIFLAKEYGVTVFANDLWISATENLARFQEAGVADKVFPINAEAHALPYAEGFFDAIVCIDSYHYYGTSETYFHGVFAKLIKPGGQVGIVVPGFVREFECGYPETLARFWQAEPDMFTFHSKGWWRKLWEKAGRVQITACYDIADAKAIWYPWARWSKENLQFEIDDVSFLDADIDNDITLIAMVAKK